MKWITACALSLTLLAGCAPARGTAEGDPDCPVALVDGEVVTVADADVVRAAIQPPLTRDEAARLAIAATAAHHRQNPQGKRATMGARLAAYRQAVRQKLDIDGARVEPGACWSGPTMARHEASGAVGP